MRSRASSTTRCAGVQPVRPPTEPEASSAAKKAWAMNGLNRSPSASSNERPGGLAQASHAAASMLAMDGTTRAVNVEDMGDQAVRTGIAYPQHAWRHFRGEGGQAAREAQVVSRSDPGARRKLRALRSACRLEPRPRKTLSAARTS